MKSKMFTFVVILVLLITTVVGCESSTTPTFNGRIAFGSDRDGESEIYVMDGDTSNLTNLTNNPDADFMPAWSPDGNKIAFTSDRDGNTEIYVMDADGSNLANLTNNPASDDEPTWSRTGARSPSHLTVTATPRFM